MASFVEAAMKIAGAIAQVGASAKKAAAELSNAADAADRYTESVSRAADTTAGMSRAAGSGGSVSLKGLSSAISSVTGRT
jgi:hypothetical protein